MRTNSRCYVYVLIVPLVEAIPPLSHGQSFVYVDHVVASDNVYVIRFVLAEDPEIT